MTDLKFAEGFRYDRRSAELFGGVSESVLEFLNVLHSAGDVFEVRILHCPQKLGNTYARTTAGYFNNTQLAKQHIEKWDRHLPPAIYVTLNPVASSLLARANNRLVFNLDSTTSDDQVDRRRWLLVDIDPKRPPKISATDAEMQAALNLAATIRKALASEGWPKPLFGMSGNGAYLLYRVDLPNDVESTKLSQNVLRAFAHRFNTAAAEVDEKTFNASRIGAALGTTKRKGDSLKGAAGIEDRPHRKTWFERPTGDVQPVSRELLVAMAATAPAPKVHAPVIIQPQGTGKGKKKQPATPLQRCLALLAKLPDAISGSGGHGKTLQAARECWGFLTDYNEIFQAMQWWNQNKCGGEEFPDNELEHKIEEGRKAAEAAGTIGSRLNQERPNPRTKKPAAKPQASPIPPSADATPTDPQSVIEATDAPPPPVSVSKLADPEINAPAEKAIVDALKIDVLGCMRKGEIKVFSTYHRRTSVINRAAKLYYEDMLTIAGEPARDVIATSAEGDIPEGQYPMTAVRGAIALLAGYRSLSDHNELGMGCWPGATQTGEVYPSVVLVNKGEGAEWNGDQVLRRIDHPRCRGHILDFESARDSWYDFDRLAALLQQCKSSEFRVSVYQSVLDVVNRWHWKTETSPQVCTALIFASLIQTLWEWRPQVTIVGGSSTGKSLFTQLMRRLLGKLGQTSTDASAAGMRQVIQSTARVIVHDEFDLSSSEDKGRKLEHDKILKMIRAAGRGDETLRGTPDQRGQSFTLQHIVWLLGIHLASSQEADRNRTICMELLPKIDGANALEVPQEGELAELGQKMLAVAIFCANDAKHLAGLARQYRFEGSSNRIIESYAVPAAMMAAIEGSGEARVNELVGLMLADVDLQDRTVASDTEDLLSDIFHSKIQIGPHRFTVGQLFGMANDPTHENRFAADEALQAHGIRRMKHGENKDTPSHLHGKACLALAHKAISSQLLKDSPRWRGQAIDMVLKRYKDAITDRKLIGGVFTRCISLPLEMLRYDLLDLACSDF